MGKQELILNVANRFLKLSDPHFGLELDACDLVFDYSANFGVYAFKAIKNFDVDPLGLSLKLLGNLLVEMVLIVFPI